MKMKNKKIIVSLSFLFVFFAVGSASAVNCPSGDFDGTTGVCIPTGTGLPDAGGDKDPITAVAKNFMKWVLAIVGMIGVIAFTISGIKYLLSAGDEKAIESAKNSMKWSIVGVIAALMGYVIIQAVDAMLRESVDF